MPIFLPPERWLDIGRECGGAVWQDIDLNDFRCPANTVGVMVAQQMPVENLRRNNFGVRKNGSTDTGNRAYRSSGTRTVEAQSWKVAVAGCDANKLIEIYLDSAHTPSVKDKIWIIGWFLEGEAVFFDNFVLPDDAGWRAAWVDSTTWYELDMSSVEPPEGPPAGYIFSQYNGHWSSGNYVFLPSGRQTGPEGTLNNYRFYETHGSFHVCPPGANNNVAFVCYGTSANIEAQVIGYLTEASGFTDVGNMIVRVGTPGGDGFTYVSRALADYITVPDNTVAFSPYPKTGAAGCVGGTREHNPRSSIQYSAGYGNYGGPPVLNTDAGNLFDVSGKWQDFLITGVYVAPTVTTPQPPAYANRSDFIGDPVSVDLSTGWVDADPDGFTVDQLPAGLSMTPQGVVTGTPTTAAVTTVTVTNLGVPGGGGAVIDRPEGALLYDDFFQYDVQQSVDGVDLTATYGTWRQPTWATLQFAAPDLVSNTLRRPSEANSSSIATYYAAPADACIAFTLSGLWKNATSSGSTLTIYHRQAVDGTAGYHLIISPSFNTAFDMRIVRRVADGTSTTVDEVLNNTQAFADGDRIRWEVSGTYHKVWYRDAGSGVETQLLSFDDTGGAGAAPGNTSGDLVIRWDKSSGTQLYPISDFGVWPAGAFVEPSVQANDSFDWTIAAKPVLTVDNIAAESYAQPVRVLNPSYWSNVVGGSFNTVSLLSVDSIAAASSLYPVAVSSQHPVTVDDIAAASSLDPVAVSSQHIVTVDSLAAGSNLDPVAVSSQHLVTVDSIAAASHIKTVSLPLSVWSNVVGGNFTTLAGGVTLAVDSIAAASHVDPVSVSSEHIIAAGSIAAASHIDPVAIDTEHHLTVADIAAASHIDPIELATEGRLGVAPIAAQSYIAPVRVVHTQRLVAAPVAAASHVDPVSLSTSFRLEVASVAANSYVEPMAVTAAHLVNAEDIRAGPHLDPVAIASDQRLQVASIAADSYAQPVFLSTGLVLLPIGFKPVVEDVSDTLTAVCTGDTYVIMDTGSVLCVADVTDTLLTVNA